MTHNVLRHSPRVRGLALGESGPLALNYVPLDEGPVVLYGLNGSGKTFILDSLKACLQGFTNGRLESTTPALIVDFWRDDASTDDDWAIEWAMTAFGRRNTAFDYFLEHTAGDTLPYREDETQTFTDKEMSDPVESLIDLWTDGYSDRASIEQRELALRVCRQLTFAIRPNGHEGRPEWQIEMVASADADVSRLLDAVTEGPTILANGGLDGATLPHPIVTLGCTYHEGSRIRPFLLESLETEDAEETTLGYVKQLLSRAAARTAAERESEKATLIHKFVDSHVALGDALLGRNAHKELPSTDVRALTIEDGIAGPSPWLRGLCRELSTRATAIFSDSLSGSPALSLRIRDVDQWVGAPMLYWAAEYGGPEGTAVSIDHLSETQQRWANYAISMAVGRGWMGVLMLDEPEQGLHRAGERYLARRLLADGGGLKKYLIATHSPHFLELPGATVLKVSSGSQTPGFSAGSIRRMTSENRADAEHMGLSLQDLFVHTAVWLLVEGEHEVAIFESMIGDALRTLGVEVLALRGGSKLKTSLDAAVLQRFTDAPVVAVLDNIDPDVVNATWRDAVSISKRDGVTAGVDHLERRLKSLKTSESDWMFEYLAGAIKQGGGQRLRPWSLPAPDILEYLPVQRFLPRASSWAHAHEMAARNTGKELNGTKFKEWLCSQGADLSPRHLGAVAAETTPHSDLIALLGHIVNVRRGDEI